MAHFAKVNKDNQVISIQAVNNFTIMKDNKEDEATGIKFLQNLHDNNDTYIQTSYNANFRKNYAGIDYTYDKVRDAFIAPKPYPSWLLVEATCQWESPVAYPSDDKKYTWDEDNTKWKEKE